MGLGRCTSRFPSLVGADRVRDLPEAVRRVHGHGRFGDVDRHGERALRTVGALEGHGMNAGTADGQRVPGVNGAPSRLCVMPGAPLIVTVGSGSPVNQPFVCGPGRLGLDVAGRFGLQDGLANCLVGRDPDVAASVDRLDEPLDVGANQRACAAPAGRAVRHLDALPEPTGISVEGEDALRRLTPTLSVISTAKPTVPPARVMTGPKVGRVKSVLLAGV